jgi:hypothetical protein
MIMKHMHGISVPKAVSKQFDGESLFFSMYFMVLGIMFSAAASDK